MYGVAQLFSSGRLCHTDGAAKPAANTASSEPNCSSMRRALSGVSEDEPTNGIGFCMIL